MRAIILGAGSGSRLGGYNKLLIKDKNGCFILGRMMNDLNRIGIYDITVVVGYKAIDVMGRYPHFKYIINPIFDVTNSAYSTALAFQNDNSPAILVYGENIYPRGNPFESMNKKEDLMLVSSQTIADQHATGPIFDENNYVVGMREGLGAVPESIGVFTFYNRYIIKGLIDFGLKLKDKYMAWALHEALGLIEPTANNLVGMRAVDYPYRKFEFDTPQDYLDYLRSDEI